MRSTEMRCRIKDADESLPLDAFCIMTDKTRADSAAQPICYAIVWWLGIQASATG